MRILVGVLVGCAWTAMVRDAGAICREVGEPGEPPPTLEPDQSVLIVKRDNVVIGEICEPVGSPDAGAGLPDAGSGPPDAAVIAADASVSLSDAGAAPDGGAPDVVCEEIRGPAIRMVVQPKFRTGPGGAQFALLMVTPADPNIALEEDGLFEQLAEATKQRVVVEDVCIETASLGYQCKDPKWPSVTGECANGTPPPPPPPPPPPRPSSSGGGGGCGGGSYGDDDDDDWFTWQDAAPAGLIADAGPPPIQTIGAYEVVEVRTTSTVQLAAWLTQLGYEYDQADLDALAPYSEAGWTVIAVRISIDASFVGALEPLSFTYAGTEIRLPLGVSKQPPPAEAHLAVYIAAEGRYDVPGAAVSYAQWDNVGGRPFLTRNDLWADLSRGAEDDPIAARIADNRTYLDTVTVTREIRIPSSDCPDPPAQPDPPPDYDDGDDGYSHEHWCGCRATDFPTPGGALLVLVVSVALLRPRRRGSRDGSSTAPG